MSWWEVCEFLWCPSVNLNPQIVYNHMDAVIMCSDWDPDPPNILESDKVMFLTLNYIIQWLQRTRHCLTQSLAGTEAVFWRKSPPKCQSGQLTVTEIYISTHSLPVTDVVYQAEMWFRVGRTDRGTDRRTDASPRTAVVFVFLISAAKDSYRYYVTSFGPVTLLCGTFLFI